MMRIILILILIRLILLIILIRRISLFLILLHSPPEFIAILSFV